MPVVWPLSSVGLEVSLRMSKMHTVPSYMPAASRLGCAALKAMLVTPQGVWMTLSGIAGFFNVQNRMRPSRWSLKSNWP